MNQRWPRATRRRLSGLPAPVSLLVILLAALLLSVPAPIAAQDALPPAAPGPAEPPFLGPPPGFAVAATDHFRLFVQEGGPLAADAVAVAWGPALETAYGELTSFLPPPRGMIEVYLYKDDAAYTEAIADLRQPEPVPGPVAAAAPRGDVAASLPALLARSPLEVEAALRHAVAHVVVRQASADRLPRGFDEGFAAYVERPAAAKLARSAALVQNARARDQLLSWSDLNRPQPPPADPALVAAHAYSVVAFLVERHGLKRFGELVVALDTEPDWRAALRTVYQRSPAELEAQWLENLPRWTAGGWRENAFAAFDLDPARDLLAQGRYAAAQRELEQSLRLFTDLGLTDRQAEAEPLLRQSETGLQAEALMEQIEQALGRHAYDRAATLLTQARAQYAMLPTDQRPQELIDRYGELAETGLAAVANLDLAGGLSGSWRDYPEARAAALSAGTGFARLGDQPMYDKTAAVLRDLDDRQLRLTLLLGTLAGLSAAWLALWLWARGRPDLDWGR